MSKLDDRIIRAALIGRLSALSKAPKIIIEELRVHNGNAIADVVTVHNHPHCYEIKSDNDNIHRVLKQSAYYDLVFNKTTLVTTESQLKKALQLTPAHWGIMLARETSGLVKLGYARAAKQSPYFDKRLALLTLWKSELLDIAFSIEVEQSEKLNRTKLSELIAEKERKNTLIRRIGEKLIARPVKQQNS